MDLSAPLVLQVSTLPQQGWVGSLSSLSSHTQLQSFLLWFVCTQPCFPWKRGGGGYGGAVAEDDSSLQDTRNRDVLALPAGVTETT